MSKEKQAEWNEELSQRFYTLKEDVSLNTGEVFLKGTIVKIYIESTPSLLKIKCYLPNQTRESARGRLAHYVENDTIQKKFLDKQDLEEIINQKFQLHDPKLEPKNVKKTPPKN